MPILECILIDASTDVIKLTGNDMELGIDLDKIKEVLKLSRGGDILEIDQNDEKNRLIIRVGNIVRKMNLVDTAG